AAGGGPAQGTAGVHHRGGRTARARVAAHGQQVVRRGPAPGSPRPPRAADRLAGAAARLPDVPRHADPVGIARRGERIVGSRTAPPQPTALWHGLRTVPLPVTEGLQSTRETCGRPEWHRPETVPQRGRARAALAGAAGWGRTTLTRAPRRPARRAA